MNEEFIQYLGTIGVSNVLRSRIEQLISDFSVLIPEEPEIIFVTNHIDDKGKPHFDSLWVFSKNYLHECKNIATEENIDSVRYNGKIKYMSVKTEKYNFGEATEESRLHVRINLGEDLYAELKAARHNCNFLRDIIVHRFKPRI